MSNGEQQKYDSMGLFQQGRDKKWEETRKSKYVCYVLVDRGS